MRQIWSRNEAKQDHPSPHRLASESTSRDVAILLLHQSLNLNRLTIRERLDVISTEQI